jgi:hypothetical protein
MVYPKPLPPQPVTVEVRAVALEKRNMTRPQRKLLWSLYGMEAARLPVRSHRAIAVLVKKGFIVPLPDGRYKLTEYGRWLLNPYPSLRCSLVPVLKKEE